jgi:type I restriction enzyme R subunit
LLAQLKGEKELQQLQKKDHHRFIGWRYPVKKQTELIQKFIDENMPFIKDGDIDDEFENSGKIKSLSIRQTM